MVGRSGGYDAVRAMMDNLMGEDRDLPPDQRGQRRRDFTDPEVDRFYLCGCSPYVLLANTKSESMLPVVEPKLIQDDRLKAEWDKLPQAEKDRYGFEHELMAFLQDMVSEMDRRIHATQRRLDAQAEPAEPEVTPETAEELQSLTDQIQELQVKAELAGEQGEIDESLALNEQAEALTRRKAEVEATIEAQRQQLAARRQCVCTVSGLQYAANDNEARMAELQAGRQYRGWKAMRDKLEELTAKRPPRGAGDFARRPGFSRVARERGGSPSRDRDVRPSGSRDRDRPTRDYAPRPFDQRPRPYDRGGGGRSQDRDRDYDGGGYRGGGGRGRYYDDRHRDDYAGRRGGDGYRRERRHDDYDRYGPPRDYRDRDRERDYRR